MLYDDYKLDFENQGLSVFIHGYENRGPNNERRRIYQSAVTPDLFPKYRAKIDTFYDRFLADANAGTPLMKHYFDNYYDLYWDLHLGAKGNEIPEAQYHLVVAGGSPDCRLSIADLRLAAGDKSIAIGKSEIENPKTRPLPRGGTDLILRRRVLACQS